MSFSFEEYQAEADQTAIYPDAGEGTADAISYVVLGLVGEAGEVANKFKKVLRDQDGDMTDKNVEDFAAEVGDVLWYCARMAEELGFDLGVIAENNIEKLQSRKSRNMLQGAGDNR